MTLSSFKATISTRRIQKKTLQGSQVCMTCYHWRCEALTHASNKQSKSIKKYNTNTRGCALTPCVLSCGFVVFNLKSKAQGSVTHPPYGRCCKSLETKGYCCCKVCWQHCSPSKQMVTWFRFRDEHMDPITFPQMMSKGCFSTTSETKRIVFRFHYHSKFRWARIPKAVVSFP